MPASDVSVEVTYEQIGTGSTVSVIAYYDADTYDVYSSTNYDWDFAEGFTMERGATFYLSVSDYEGSNFYVGVKIGDTVTVYPADFDDMMGGYSFGKALVADGPSPESPEKRMTTSCNSRTLVLSMFEWCWF